MSVERFIAKSKFGPVLLSAVIALAAVSAASMETGAIAQGSAKKPTAAHALGAKGGTLTKSAPPAKSGAGSGAVKPAGAPAKHDNSARAAVKKGSKLFLWKITSDSGAVVYLLGTIHVFRRDFYPLPDEIEKALDKSKLLLLEVAPADKPESGTAKKDENASKDDSEDKPIVEPGEDASSKDKSNEQSEKKTHELLTSSEGKYFYPKTDNLGNHVSKTTLALLQRYCASLDVPESKYMRMRPWFASFYISYYELARLGFYAKMGIDEHLTKEAKVKGKKVLGLETKDFHEDVTAGIPADLQDRMLKQTLQGFSAKPEPKISEKPSDGKPAPHNPSLFGAWLKGDDKEMLECVIKDEKKNPEMAPVQNRILYDRNDTMLDAIEPYLKGTDVSMVAVGSAHLVGEKGIVAMLKQKGYKVSQVLVGDEI